MQSLLEMDIRHFSPGSPLCVLTHVTGQLPGSTQEPDESFTFIGHHHLHKGAHFPAFDLWLELGGGGYESECKATGFISKH